MSERPSVSIVLDPADPAASAGPVGWALAQLREALAARGLAVEAARRLAEASPDAECILVASGASAMAREVLHGAGASAPDAPEALALAPSRLAGRAVVLACGADVRGLVYAVLELADRVTCAADPLDALRIARPVVERPANPIRGVARLFVSDVEDKPWLYDRSFWRRYLTMLVAQRFNRFHLALGIGHDFVRDVRDAYFLFPYPFLVSVPGYDVRVSGLPDAERERNLETLRFVAEEAAARGLHFQLGLWMHAYEWIDSPSANHTIEGLTPESHAAYCRDALRTLLAECPAIAGVTLRVHGESGIPEGSYAFWRTVLDGVVQCGRRVEIDLHPKGIDREMIQVALATGMPVNISPKYTAEHMGLPYHQASIRELERAPRLQEGDRLVGTLMSLSAGSRRFTRYGYADYLTEDRPYGVFFRVWPGTQRLLLWGDPALAAGFGRHASFCGCLGAEIMEPLSFKGRRGSGLPGGRDAYADASLRPAGGDWEKYLYTYRLFGRLLYNPDADPESWRRFLVHELGEAAAPAEAALASASRILPLVTTAHHPSAANNRYWPEMYTNMPIVDEARPHPYGDTPSPKRFGTVSPLDPELFARIDDFADEVVSGEPSGRYSPLRVARWLDDLAGSAARHLAEAEARIVDRGLPAFRRLAVDVAIQSALGRFFAGKLRAGVAHALYARTGDAGRLREALEAYRSARAAWVEAAERARGVYRDDVTVGGEACLRGHWADRLAAIDADLGDLAAEWERAMGAAGPAGERRGPAAAEGMEGTAAMPPLAALDDAPPRATCSHVPPASFQRGQPVTVELAVRADGEGAGPISVRLRYRRVSQAESYRVVEMERAAGVQDGVEHYWATIPGDYADSPYPLQYFFELREGRGARVRAWLHPGLAADLANQPYFVVRQVRQG